VFSQMNGGALLQHQHLHFPWGLVHLQQFVYEIREVSMLSVFAVFSHLLNSSGSFLK
jgi:hypothetical protein